MNKTPAHSTEGGFTLVEVLVALTILSISLGVLLGVFSTALDRTRESNSETIADSLTQSLLAEMGSALPLAVGDSKGTFANGFHWRLHIEPYGSSEDVQAWPVAALVVSASTLWDDDKRSVTLSTLRIAPKASQ